MQTLILYERTIYYEIKRRYNTHISYTLRKVSLRNTLRKGNALYLALKILWLY